MQWLYYLFLTNSIVPYLQGNCWLIMDVKGFLWAYRSHSKGI